MNAVFKQEGVEQALSALLKVIEKKHETERRSKALLEDEDEQIKLMITLKKIPPIAIRSTKVVKVPLTHPIYTETTSICLFVNNLTKFKIDDDATKHHYRELLDSQGIKCIDEIIPLHQLTAEFKPFEAKRHLCNSYQLFLTDERIVENLPKLIGREFWEKKRLPVKVNIKSKDLKGTFQKALGCTYLYTHGQGSSWSVPVACRSYGEKKIIENVFKVVEKVQDIIPGGWENVRGIYLKTRSSLAIPVFLSTDSPNDVHLKKVGSKRDHIIAQELSTKLNTKVKVTLRGKVKVIQNADMPDGDEESTDEEADFRDLISSRRKLLKRKMVRKDSEKRNKRFKKMAGKVTRKDLKKPNKRFKKMAGKATNKKVKMSKKPKVSEEKINK